jgi:hypothetical protein
LFLLVWPEIALFTEKLAEQIGQFVQVFGRRRLNDDMIHCGFIIEKAGSGNSRFCPQTCSGVYLKHQTTTLGARYTSINNCR